MMMKHPRIWIGLLIGILTWSVEVGIGAESVPDVTITPQEVDEVRIILLSGVMDRRPRLELGETVVQLLEARGRSTEARRFLQQLFEELMPLLKMEDLPEANLPAPLVEAAKKVDEGKRGEARALLVDLLEKGGKANPPPLLSLLSLKVDDLISAYHALFSDAKDGSLTPYSRYVLGVLSIRQQQFADAERWFESAVGKLGSPRLERWLTIDRAKFAIVTQGYDKAHPLIDGLLQANPKDAQAWYWKGFVQLAQGQKELARQTLARLVPLMPADPAFLAEVATLALHLDELETAATLMETFEKKVEPNRDFYEMFSLVRKAQNRSDEAAAYLQRSTQVPATPSPSYASFIQTEELNKILADIRNKRRQEVRALSQTDGLNRIYLLLLDYDGEGAIKELLAIKRNAPEYPFARWLLATLHRRTGDDAQALDVLKELHRQYSDFRTYAMLAELADLSVRVGKGDDARTFYQQLAAKYPGSQQAEVAARYLQAGRPESATHAYHAIHISPLVSRYNNYAAPFVITEVMRHWSDHVSFALVNSRLGTSPRTGLEFNALLAALLQGTQYQLIPFIGTAEVTAEFLDHHIPILFCQGEMFASQRVNRLSILTGYDLVRRVIYAESVTMDNSHSLTENEILEGICIAVSPISQMISLSETAKRSASFGEEYLALNAAAALIRKKDSFDPKHFNARMETLPQETARGFIPHQLALLQYLITQEKPEKAAALLTQIESTCAGSGQYWFKKAALEFRRKEIPAALESIDRALRYCPDSIPYQLARARLLETSGKIQDAIEMVQRLRKDYPDDPTVSIHLIAFYKKNGDTQAKQAEEDRLKNLLKVDSIQVNLEEGM